MILYTAPEEYDRWEHSKTAKVFIAGTIEQGASRDWQQEVIDRLDDLDVVVFNPRRTNWDPTWPQDASFAPFREQVEWELDRLDDSDLILLSLMEGTKSPISLLELGLHANYGKLIVHCDPGFWRRGNVEIVCQRFNIPSFDTLNEAVGQLRYTLLY